MRAEYIINAIKMLEDCEKALVNFNITPEERGSLSAKAWIAANQLRVYSGINDSEVEVVKEAA